MLQSPSARRPKMMTRYRDRVSRTSSSTPCKKSGSLARGFFLAWHSQHLMRFRDGPKYFKIWLGIITFDDNKNGNLFFCILLNLLLKLARPYFSLRNKQAFKLNLKLCLILSIYPTASEKRQNCQSNNIDFCRVPKKLR